MKREIKFRAWDGKRMYSPKNDILSPVRDKIEGTYLFQILEEVDGDGRGANRESCVLMQFTGEKDKVSGKEIYENDICLATYKDWGYIQEVTGTIVFEDHMWLLKTDKDSYQLKEVQIIEVIGNTYQK